MASANSDSRRSGSSSPSQAAELALLEDSSSPLADAPALLILLFSCSFIATTEGGLLPPAAAFALSLCLPAGWCIFGTTRPNRSSSAAAVILLLLCSLLGVRYRLDQLDEPPLPAPLDAEVCALDVRQSFIGSFLVAAEVLDDVGPFSARRVLIEIRSGAAEPRPGDVMLVSGVVEPFSTPSSPDLFDERAYWRAKGCDGRMAPRDLRTVGTMPTVGSIRRALSDRIRETLPPLTAGYVDAISTGERDSTLLAEHRAAGTSHLLAVSGFHVGIVCLLATAVFARRIRGRIFFISSVIWAYALLCGASASAIRAAAMLQITLLGGALGRGGSSFNAACAAGCIMLAAEPRIFGDVGWRLSMLAILSVTSVSCSKMSGVAQTVSAGVCVWLTTSALSASVFGSVPIAGLFLNFIAVPLFSLLLPLSVLLSLPALAGLPGGAFLAEIPESFFSLWSGLSANAVRLIPGEIHASAALIPAATLALSFFMASCSGFRSRTAAAAAICTVLAAALVML